MTDSRDNLLEQFSAYLDGELSAEETLAVETALAEDSTLAEELEAMRQMREMLGSIPEEDAPPYLSDRILARMNRKVDARLSKRPLRSARWITYAAAAVVLITVGITYVAFLQTMTEDQGTGELATSDSREDDRVETDRRLVRSLDAEGPLDDALADLADDSDVPLDAIDSDLRAFEEGPSVIAGVPGEELTPDNKTYEPEGDTSLAEDSRDYGRLRSPGEDVATLAVAAGSFDRAVDQFEAAMTRNDVTIRESRRVGDAIEYDVVTDVTTAHRVMEEFQEAQAAEPAPAAILAQASTGLGYAGMDAAGNRAPDASDGAWMSSEGEQLPIQSQVQTVARDTDGDEVEPFYYRQIALAPRGTKGVNAVELPSQYLADADLKDTPDSLPEGTMTNAAPRSPEDQEMLRRRKEVEEQEWELAELSLREADLRAREEQLVQKLDELKMLTAKLSDERVSVETAKVRTELQDVRKQRVAIETERAELASKLQAYDYEVASVAEASDSTWEDDGGLTRPTSVDAALPETDADDSAGTGPAQPTTEVVADVTKRGGDASRDDATTPRTMRFVLKQISPETVANYQQFARRFRETEEIDVYIIEDVATVERADALEAEVAAEATETLDTDNARMHLEAAEPATTPESDGEPAGD